MYWNWFSSYEGRSREMINRNMRCIEMIVNTTGAPIVVVINRNMRCIEMEEILRKLANISWLIETWDVLKSLSVGY